MLISIKRSLIALSCLAALGLGSSAAFADNAIVLNTDSTQASGIVPVDAYITGVHGIVIHRPECMPGPFPHCVHGIIIHHQCTAWEIFGGERHCIRWSKYL